jgi:beta-N-acetylhexosaminidase
MNAAQQKPVPPLDKALAAEVDRRLDAMSVTELAAQVLCPNLKGWGETKTAELADAFALGAIFVADETPESLRMKTRVAAERLPDRPLVVADLVMGAGYALSGATLFPWEMAMGAADSEELCRIEGEAAAHEGRAAGINWTLAPVCDLNRDFRNSMMYARCYGDEPGPVLERTRAFVQGVQAGGLMAATAKHFPGDGADDRDPHISTPVNPLSRGEWDDTYGRVWRGLIEAGVLAVMPGHIALPAVDPGDGGPCPPPATFSEKLLTGFLRGELGFDGIIISDAMKMTGLCSHAPLRERAARALAAGVDMILFASTADDHAGILDALREGRLREERLRDAARRVLDLKARLGLFGPEPEVAVDRPAYEAAVREVSRRCVVPVREQAGLLPLQLGPGARVLTISIDHPDIGLRGMVQGLEAVDEALAAHGMAVTHLDNPPSGRVLGIMADFEAIFVNFHFPPHYGTTRMDFRQFLSLRESFWPDHPRVVFTAFCNPYLVWELNHLPNLLTVYSNNIEAQQAAVAFWLGHQPVVGRHPVNLPLR